MKKMDRLLKEWIMALCAAVIIVFILNVMIWPMSVDGNSMENTLSDGDFIWVSKALMWIRPCQSGDLVVVRYHDAGQTNKIVKRIIGVEGDHIVIKNGQVLINGTLLDELYASSTTQGEIDLFVPKDGFFLLGDNRKVSKDSREFGCIYQDALRGIVVFKN